MNERKTGTYFVEGLSSKSNKRIFSKNFKSEREAFAHAVKLQKKGRIVQSDIIFTKNALSDVKVGGVNTLGKKYKGYY